MERDRTPKSKLWWGGMAGVVLVVAAMVVVLCLFQFRSEEPSVVDTSVPDLSGPSAPDKADDPIEPPVGYRIGNRAPSFSLLSLEGKAVSLSDYRGRLVILDFWASWCVPCRLSMPSLEALSRDLGDDVILLGISLDRSESAARSFIESREYSELIVLYGSLSEARTVAEDYAVLGIPKTFIIDGSGVVRFAGHPGRLTRSLVESLL